MTQLQIWYVGEGWKIAGYPDTSPNDESQMWRYLNMTIDRKFEAFLQDEVS
jgi:hypothetical protein